MLRPTRPGVMRNVHVPRVWGSLRREISAPDHNARIKAVETLLREGLGTCPGLIPRDVTGRGTGCLGPARFPCFCSPR